MNWLSSRVKKIKDLFSPHQRKLKKFAFQHHFDKKLVSSLNKSKLPSLKQLKYLNKVLTRGEKWQMAGVTVILLFCLVALSGQFYLAMTTTIPKAGGEYTEGLIGSPRYVNPILAQTNEVDLDLARLIFSGLLKQDKNHQLVTDLAESYEISADQLVYTFKLKSNIKWHDGEPFRADDVIFTFASLQDPEFKSPLLRSFRGVMGEKIDETTVRFTLKEPFSPFLGLLTFGILPEHLWYNVAPATSELAELNKRPVGTGPWRFDNFKKDKTGVIKSYTIIPNPYYYGDKPYLQKIIFKFYGDTAAAVEAIKNKEVMAISYLPKDLKDELKKYKNLVYHNLNQPQYTAIFFNQNENELLQADYIRQSLALATDKEKIIREAFNNEGRAIDGPTLPGMDLSPNIQKYGYEPQVAAELLEKNAWVMTATTTEGGITQQLRMKKAWPLEITLTTVNQPENVKIAELVKESWNQIGWKTNLEIVDKAKIMQDAINPRKYQALLFGENLGSDPDPFPFWHSSQNEYPGLNLAIFSNKRVDQLIEEARKTNNWEERQKKYTEFQEIVAKELPAIFLYNPTYTYPQDKQIKGFNSYNVAVPSDRFANLNEWYMKTKRVWK